MYALSKQWICTADCIFYTVLSVTGYHFTWFYKLASHNNKNHEIKTKILHNIYICLHFNFKLKFQRNNIRTQSRFQIMLWSRTFVTTVAAINGESRLQIISSITSQKDQCIRPLGSHPSHQDPLFFTLWIDQGQFPRKFKQSNIEFHFKEQKVQTS